MNELKDTSETEFYEKLFEKSNMEEEALVGKEFYNCNFVQCNFKRSKLSNSIFKDCKFESCDLSLAKIEKTGFQDIRFEKTKMIGVDWTIAALQKKSKLHNRLTFIGSDVSFSLFMNLNLNGISMIECKAKEADFSEADLSNANLVKTDFDSAIFYNSVLIGTDFSQATNYRINICDNKVEKARFSFPEVLNLLRSHHIIIEDFDKENF